MRQLAHVLEDSERSYRAGYQDFVFRGLAGFAGDFYGAMIQLGHALGHAELAELVTVGTEGVGLDDLRAGFDVGLMNVKDGVAVGDVELVHAALRADGFIEQGTHGAVGDQDGLGESFIEIFDAHSFWFLPAPQLPPSEALLPQGPATRKKFVIIPSAEPGTAKRTAGARKLEIATMRFLAIRRGPHGLFSTSCVRF